MTRVLRFWVCLVVEKVWVLVLYLISLLLDKQYPIID